MATSNLTGLDVFCGSKFWDLDVSWNTEHPDFTLCFQRTVLIWIPCFFLWLASPLIFIRIAFSSNKPIGNNVLNIFKTLLSTSLVVLCIVEIIHGFDDSVHDVVPPSFYFSSLMKMMTFVLTLILIQLDRSKGIPASGPLCTFWLILAFCGIAEFRYHIRSATNHDSNWDHTAFVLFMIYYPIVLAQFILSLFLDFKPKEGVINPRKCPQNDSSLLSYFTFAWIDYLMWLGYKKPLVRADVYELDDKDKSPSIVPEFEAIWEKALAARTPDGSFQYTELSESNKMRRASLIFALWKTFWPTLLLSYFFMLLTDICIFINPLVLNMLIDFMSSDQELWKGYLYGGLLFANGVVQTFTMNWSHFMVQRTGVRVQSVLIAAIYKKALTISNTARKENTVGEIVNLMSVDVRIMANFVYFTNNLWSAPLQLIIGLYFLYYILGISIFAGIVVVILMIPANIYITYNLEKLQIAQMEKKDLRVKIMNEILNGIKVLKMYAWEKSFQSEVDKVRTQEMGVLTRTAWFSVGECFLWQCAPYLVAVASFAAFVMISDENILDAKTAFVSLTLFNILRNPLAELPGMISATVQANVSLKRVNKFLNEVDIDRSNVKRDDVYSQYDVEIENGSFVWAKGEQEILRNINIQVKPGSLVAIVGIVGAGKTSLINALLGELEATSGSVSCRGAVAYVPQQAWIQNATVRDNILMNKKFDMKTYRKVVAACALKPDLDMLPGGDQTEIGEKGINISGGQKQRVSLARAVYSDRDVYLLDDPLSAVDAHVGKHLFSKVVGPSGVLNKKTRILVTHGVTFLPHVDYIYVLKDGEIAESGRFQELLLRKEAFSSFLLEHLVQSDGGDSPEELQELADRLETTMGKETFQKRLSHTSEEVAAKKHLDVRHRTESLRSRGESLSRTRTESMNRMAVPETTMRERTFSRADSMASDEQECNGEQVGTRLIGEETQETGVIKMAILKAYFGTMGWGTLIAILVLNFITTAFSVGSNIWLSDWSEATAQAVNGSLPPSERDMYLGIYGALSIIQVTVQLICTTLIFLSLLKVSRVLHSRMLTTIMRCPQHFFDQNPVGRILSRFSNDVYTVDVLLPFSIGDLVVMISTVFATFFVIMYTTPMFLAVAVPVLILYGFVQRFYVASNRQLQRLESVSRSPIYSHFSETITGVSSIRAYELQDHFLRQSQGKVDENQCYFYYFAVIGNRWIAIRLMILANLIVLCAALMAISQRESVYAALAGLSVSYAMNVTWPLNWLVRMFSQMETNIVSVERMEEFSHEKTEAAWEIEETKPHSAWPHSGQVMFKNYQTRYREGLELVLKDVTFTINPKEKVGIVGRTGAGKSSLTLALFRIIEAAGGQILVDGLDVSTLGLHDLRKKLTIIPQDPLLFSGTMRFNLDPFSVYTDEEIWRCLEHAHLKKFVEGLPDTLQYEIHEEGSNLSVGQRQLVCLARALLRNTKILILDEATAAVDLDTDSLIQNTIRDQFKDCTVITIAHRLNTILDYDRVIVLDKGRVQEYDSPTNLMNNKNSLFHSMAKDASLA